MGWGLRQLKVLFMERLDFDDGWMKLGLFCGVVVYEFKILSNFVVNL